MQGLRNEDCHAELRMSPVSTSSSRLRRLAHSFGRRLPTLKALHAASPIPRVAALRALPLRRLRACNPLRITGLRWPHGAVV